MNSTCSSVSIAIEESGDFVASSTFRLPTGKVVNLVPNVDQFKPLQEFIDFAVGPMGDRDVESGPSAIWDDDLGPCCGGRERVLPNVRPIQFPTYTSLTAVITISGQRSGLREIFPDLREHNKADLYCRQLPHHGIPVSRKKEEKGLSNHTMRCRKISLISKYVKRTRSRKVP